MKGSEMAKTKKPPNLPVIRLTMAKLQALSVGDSLVVGPCTASSISALISQVEGRYSQREVLVIEPKTQTLCKYHVVTRTK